MFLCPQNLMKGHGHRKSVGQGAMAPQLLQAISMFEVKVVNI